MRHSMRLRRAVLTFLPVRFKRYDLRLQFGGRLGLLAASSHSGVPRINLQPSNVPIPQRARAIAAHREIARATLMMASGSTLALILILLLLTSP